MSGTKKTHNKNNKQKKNLTIDDNINKYKRTCIKNAISHFGNVLFALSIPSVCIFTDISTVLIMVGIVAIPIVINVISGLEYFKEHNRIATGYYYCDVEFECKECGEIISIQHSKLKEYVKRLKKNQNGTAYEKCKYCGGRILIYYEKELQDYENYMKKTGQKLN